MSKKFTKYETRLKHFATFAVKIYKVLTSLKIDIHKYKTRLKNSKLIKAMHTID